MKRHHDLIGSERLILRKSACCLLSPLYLLPVVVVWPKVKILTNKSALLDVELHHFWILSNSWAALVGALSIHIFGLSWHVETDDPEDEGSPEYPLST